eukprot:5564283-Amphidinium_carterae.2
MVLGTLHKLIQDSVCKTDSACQHMGALEPDCAQYAWRGSEDTALVPLGEEREKHSAYGCECKAFMRKD